MSFLLKAGQHASEWPTPSRGPTYPRTGVGPLPGSEVGADGAVTGCARLIEGRDPWEGSVPGPTFSPAGVSSALTYLHPLLQPCVCVPCWWEPGPLSSPWQATLFLHRCPGRRPGPGLCSEAHLGSLPSQAPVRAPQKRGHGWTQGAFRK